MPIRSCRPKGDNQTCCRKAVRVKLEGNMTKWHVKHSTKRNTKNKT